MQYVYLLRAGENHYKIGVATNILKRVGSIQTSNPNKVEIVKTIICEDAYQIEGRLHKSYIDVKAKGGSEWFVLEPREVIDLCIIMSSHDGAYKYTFDDKLGLMSLFEKHLQWKKSLEKKLDLIMNNYQKALARDFKTNIKSIQAEPVLALEEQNEPDEDPYISKAIELMRETGKLSTSLLQRKLRIGYGRAARIVDELEGRGLVSKLDGSLPRTILMPEGIPTEAALKAMDLIQ